MCVRAHTCLYRSISNHAHNHVYIMQVRGPGADKGGRGGHKSQAVAQKDLMLLGKSCVLYDLTTQLASCSLVRTVALHDLHMREWRPTAPVSGRHRIIPPSRVFSREDEVDCVSSAVILDGWLSLCSPFSESTHFQVGAIGRGR